MSACPECGAPLAPRCCDTLFQTLLALDHSRQAPWGPHHGVAVACFLVQHPARVPASARPVYWAMLHRYRRGGLAAVGAVTERIRQLNSHRRGGRAPAANDYPDVPPFPDTDPPVRYLTTIADVAVDGTFPAAGYQDRVRAWAAGTIAAWSGGSGGQPG
jgi:Family of unknown function (DUF5946)